MNLYNRTIDFKLFGIKQKENEAILAVETLHLKVTNHLGIEKYI